MFAKLETLAFKDNINNSKIEMAFSKGWQTLIGEIMKIFSQINEKKLIFLSSKNFALQNVKL